MPQVVFNTDPDLYTKLEQNAKQSHASLGQYINSVLKTNTDYVPNLEKARFIGYIVSRDAIKDDYDTVVLGGSNYTYKLLGVKNLDGYNKYQVIDYVDGNIVLKPFRK